MSITAEIKLDYDNSVSTEDRFAIRKTLDKFVAAVNSSDVEFYKTFVSDGAIIEGFSDIPQVKSGYITMLSRRFSGNAKNFMRFPELKLSSNRFMYHMEGTYEDFIDGILATEGTIEISMIKTQETYQFAKIVFFPRMMIKEDNL